MLYVAIILILTGILLLAYSLIVEPSHENRDYSSTSKRLSRLLKKTQTEDGPGKKVPLRKYSGPVDNGTGEDQDVREVRGGALRQDGEETEKEPLEIDEIDRNAITAASSSDGKEENYPDSPEDMAAGDISITKDTGRESGETGADDASPPGHDNVVLYEDESGIIDYSSGTSVIDPTLEKYQQIKRIGQGKFTVAQQGINFYIDKKFFRFDFHKIQDLRFGENFIALNLRGSSPVRLFLLNDAEGFIRDVDGLFSKYRKDGN